MVEVRADCCGRSNNSRVYIKLNDTYVGWYMKINSPGALGAAFEQNVVKSEKNMYIGRYVSNILRSYDVHHAYVLLFCCYIAKVYYYNNILSNDDVFIEARIIDDCYSRSLTMGWTTHLTGQWPLAHLLLKMLMLVRSVKSLQFNII